MNRLSLGSLSLSRSCSISLSFLSFSGSHTHSFNAHWDDDDDDRRIKIRSANFRLNSLNFSPVLVCCCVCVCVCILYIVICFWCGETWCACRSLVILLLFSVFYFYVYLFRCTWLLLWLILSRQVSPRMQRPSNSSSQITFTLCCFWCDMCCLVIWFAWRWLLFRLLSWFSQAAIERWNFTDLRFSRDYSTNETPGGKEMPKL